MGITKIIHMSYSLWGKSCVPFGPGVPCLDCKLFANFKQVPQIEKRNAENVPPFSLLYITNYILKGMF